MNKKAIKILIISILAAAFFPILALATNPATSLPQIGGDVHVIHAGGSGYWLNATTSSDLGRGTALLTAVSTIKSGDQIVLAQGTFDLGSLGIDLSDGYTVNNISISGAGRNLTTIKSSAGNVVIRAAYNQEVSNMTVNGTQAPNLGVIASSAIGDLDGGCDDGQIKTLKVQNVNVNESGGSAGGQAVAFPIECRHQFLYLYNSNATCTTFQSTCVALQGEGTDMQEYIYDSTITESGNGSIGVEVGTGTGFFIGSNITDSGLGGSQTIQLADNGTFGTGIAYFYSGSVTSGAGQTDIFVSDTSIMHVTAAFSYNPNKVVDESGSGTFDYMDNASIRYSIGSNGASSTVLINETDANGQQFANWIATSSLGISSLSGGVSGMLAAWSSPTALTATSAPTANYFTATSTTATSTLAGALGVGTTSPWAFFSVNPIASHGSEPSIVVGSSTGTRFIVNNTGNVGIGTSSPYATLSVVGSGGVVMDHFNATSTAGSATSTISGPALQIGPNFIGQGKYLSQTTNDMTFENFGSDGRFEFVTKGGSSDGFTFFHSDGSEVFLMSPYAPDSRTYMDSIFTLALRLAGTGSTGIDLTTAGSDYQLGANGHASNANANGGNFSVGTLTDDGSGAIFQTNGSISVDGGGCYMLAGVCQSFTGGTVTSITCNGGLSGGTITTSGTCSLNLASQNVWSSATTTFQNGVVMATSGGFIGIGTSSPLSKLSIQANNAGVAPLIVASSSGATEFSIDRFGHEVTGGTSPTCGAGCSSVIGDDQTFRATTGTGVTAVTVNFAHTYTTTPVCVASDESGGTTVSDASSTPSSVTMNLSASLTTKSIGVICQVSNNFTY